jgi:hypothetical protein
MIDISLSTGIIYSVYDTYPSKIVIYLVNGTTTVEPLITNTSRWKKRLMGYWRLWVMRGDFWCKNDSDFRFLKKLWVIRGYGLTEVWPVLWVMRGSTVLESHPYCCTKGEDFG